MKGVIMHPLLAEIFEEHPGKTVYLSLGKYPHVVVDSGTMEVTKGSDAPLTPEKMAEIINSIITEAEGAFLKKYGDVETRVDDDLYQRRVSILLSGLDISVHITSRAVRDIEAEKKKQADALHALGLIKG